MRVLHMLRQKVVLDTWLRGKFESEVKWIIETYKSDIYIFAGQVLI